MTIMIGKCDSCDKKRKLEAFSNGTSVYYKCDECIQQQYERLFLNFKKNKKIKGENKWDIEKI